MKLEDALKSIDPDMSPDHIESLVAIIQEKINVAKSEGITEGLAKSQELVEETDATCTAKLKEYAAAADKAYTKKMKSLISRLDEQHAEKLTALVEAMDEIFSDKLIKLNETIDHNHSKKLTALIEAIDEDHTNKIKYIANIFEEKAVNKVEDFINTYIEEAIPAQPHTDYAKLIRLEEAMNQLREVLVLNDDYVQTEVKEALEDANEQIEEKQSSIHQLMVENMELRKKIKKDEAVRLLESMTANMKPAMAHHIQQYFEDIDDPKVILERKEEAIKAFSSKENNDKARAINEAEESHIVIPDDDDDHDVTINENKIDDSNDDVMDMYVNKIKRSASVGFRSQS